MTAYTPKKSHALALEFAFWYTRQVAQAVTIALGVWALVIGGIK